MRVASSTGIRRLIRHEPSGALLIRDARHAPAVHRILPGPACRSGRAAVPLPCRKCASGGSRWRATGAGIARSSPCGTGSRRSEATTSMPQSTRPLVAGRGTIDHQQFGTWAADAAVRFTARISRLVLCLKLP